MHEAHLLQLYFIAFDILYVWHLPVNNPRMSGQISSIPHIFQHLFLGSGFCCQPETQFSTIINSFWLWKCRLQIHGMVLNITIH